MESEACRLPLFAGAGTLPAMSGTWGKWRWGLLLSVTALAAGCQPQKVSVPGVPMTDEGRLIPRQAGPGLVAAPESPIPDVPVPIGFEPVVGQSWSRPGGGARLVEHLYQGVGSVPEAVRFYRQHLWQEDWQFVERREAPGGAVLLYQKGPEQLRLRIWEARKITNVVVQIAPQGQLPPSIPQGPPQ